MVRSTTQFDPVTHPEAALQRRNLVIQQMPEQGMIDQAQARQALAEPLGIANPLGTRKNGCIGAGDAGFFCKYVTDYLAQAGISDGADPARRLHDPHHAGPQRDGEDEGVAERRGARRTRRTSPT